jgi:hypothetical protein
MEHSDMETPPIQPMTKSEKMARMAARLYLLLIETSFPKQNVEIMARGILIEELSGWDSGTIDIVRQIE